MSLGRSLKTSTQWYYIKDGDLKEIHISPFETVYTLGKWLYGDGYKFRAVFLSYEP